MEKNKCIKCDVENCDYNNNHENYCTLKEIKVSSIGNIENASKEETKCDSFKEKNS